MDYLLFETLRFIGISLGTGAAAILVAQWIAANQDQKVSKDEKHLLSLVHLVSRVAFILTLAAHGGMVCSYIKNTGAVLFKVDQFVFMFLAVIFIAITFYAHGVIKLRHMLAAQLSTWFALGIMLTISDEISLNASAYLYSYVIFSIFAVYLLDRAYLSAQVTHKKAKKKG